MADEMIYRPRDMYEKLLKKQYHEEAVNYFNELLEKSKVDEALNAKHVKDYNVKVEARKQAEKKLNGAKAGKGWAIVGIVLGAALAVVFTVLVATGVVPAWGIALIAGGVAIVALMIVLLCTVIKNALKRAKEAYDKAKKEEEQALQVCWDDMAPLNALFDWNMPHRIMSKVTPIIKLDENLSAKRDYELHEFYGLEDDEASTLQVLSGTIMDNPFILERVFERDIHDKRYDGSLTISWTTTYRDSQGNTHTETHTETLHAHVYHPAPFFYKNTRLIYGNEAAPKLSFTRQPNPNCKLKGNKLESYIKKRVKELKKKESKALTDNDETTNYSMMGNERFDALFGADNRDHEVQFRLLFTALAQTNMMDLLTNEEPFGDDFVFYKQKMINSIASAHSQNFNYVASPGMFFNYDCGACRNYFVNYCDEFLKGLYFDLAPLISIPLYQMHRPTRSFMDSDAAYWLPRREHEVAANSLGDSNFLPLGADPSLPVLLKERTSYRGNGMDDTVIHASSFKTTPMVDYVSVLGGDGRYHDVPVHWVQYDEVHEDFHIATTEIGGSQQIFRGVAGSVLSRYGSVSHYERGILSFFTGHDGSRFNGEELKNLFPKN